MNIDSMIKLIVGVVATVIVVMVVAVPIISDVTSPGETDSNVLDSGMNQSAAFLTEYDQFSFKISGSAVMINDTMYDIDSPLWDYVEYTGNMTRQIIAMTNEWILLGGGIQSQTYKLLNSSDDTPGPISLESSNVSFSGGTLTYIDEEGQKTAAYTGKIMAISEQGEYFTQIRTTINSTDFTIKTNSDAEIKTLVTGYNSDMYVGYAGFDGTVSNLTQTFGTASSDTDPTGFTVSTELETAPEGTYLDITGYTASGDITTVHSYQIIVPTEYQTSAGADLTDTERALLDVIPLIIAAGVLIATVGAFVYCRS